MKKVITYLLLFMLAFPAAAYAEESAVIKPYVPAEVATEPVEAPDETAEDPAPETEETEPAEEVRLIRVGLNFDSTAVGEFKAKTSEAFILPGGFTPYYTVNFYYVYETGGMKITDGTGNLLAEYEANVPCTVQAQSGAFSVGERSYRNSFEVTAEKNGLKIVNILPLDHYLYGVLPNEIYPSWGEEALKATAVAARSFTLASVSGKHKAQGFDICTNTHCQMYRGMGTENPRTNKAVDETSGLVVTYGGKVVSTMYNANNGGYTEGTENVWMAKLPYYVAKPDPYTPEDLWQVSFTPDEIQEKLKARNVDIGEIRKVVAETTAPSGRIIKLTIIGKNGEYSVEKDAIRSLFGLRSTMFKINTTGTASKSLIDAIIAMENSTDVPLAVASLTDTKLTFTFDGKGYGHGVGISQWGCKNMADLGKTYGEILAFYYEGTEIKHLDDVE